MQRIYIGDRKWRPQVKGAHTAQIRPAADQTRTEEVNTLPPQVCNHLVCSLSAKTTQINNQLHCILF